MSRATLDPKVPVHLRMPKMRFKGCPLENVVDRCEDSGRIEELPIV